MILPKFTVSSHFLGSSNLPCLVGKVKNSQLPGVAFRHIAECQEDPDCEIYLRGRDPEKISAWQQEFLDRLFTQEGLAAAISEAMKEYETSSKWGNKNYAELAEEDRRKIQQYGIAPYITVAIVVIDEVKRKVILRADAVIDGNLDEHGISIFWSKNRWRFEQADYFVSYQASFEPAREVDWRELARQHWEVLYPAAEPGAPSQFGAEILKGKWAPDLTETKRLMKRLKVPPNGVNDILRRFDTAGLCISPEVVRYFDLSHTTTFPPWGRYRVLGIEQRGSRFSLRLHSSRRTASGYEETEGLWSISTRDFWCDGKILVESVGLVYRPTDQLEVESPYYANIDEWMKHEFPDVYGSEG